MATAIRFVMNPAGVRELLKSKKVQAELKRRADLIAAAAGEGMVVATSVGPNRARAAVITGTSKAMAAEADNRALSMAVDAGRG